MTVRLLASTLVLLLTLVSTSEAAVVTDACWEKCFQVKGFRTIKIQLNLVIVRSFYLIWSALD
jgi:hypothetical protein